MQSELARDACAKSRQASRQRRCKLADRKREREISSDMQDVARFALSFVAGKLGSVAQLECERVKATHETALDCGPLCSARPAGNARTRALERQSRKPSAERRRSCSNERWHGRTAEGCRWPVALRPQDHYVGPANWQARPGKLAGSAPFERRPR